MPINAEDLKMIVRLLGSDGAKSGLRVSPITIEELNAAAAELNLRVSENAKRNDIISFIVDYFIHGDRKSLEEMFEMQADEILGYFERVNITTPELLEISKKIGIKLSANSKKNLRKFIASQIAENTLFSRIAENR